MPDLYPQTPDEAYELATAPMLGMENVVGALSVPSLASLLDPAAWLAIFENIKADAAYVRPIQAALQTVEPAAVAQFINLILNSIPAPTPAATT